MESRSSAKRKMVLFGDDPYEKQNELRSKTYVQLCADYKKQLKLQELVSLNLFLIEEEFRTRGEWNEVEKKPGRSEKPTRAGSVGKVSTKKKTER